MEAFQFQRTKKKQANEDNAGNEQKNYCLVLNSNDRVAGTTHNEAQFNIPFEFLPHNYEYYKCEFSFQSSCGFYRDAYGEFGGTMPSTSIFAAQVFDPQLPSSNLTIDGSRLYTSDTSVTLPYDLRIEGNITGLGTGGQYQLNQSITTIPTSTFTGAMANGTNVITGVVGTPVIGRFVQAAGLSGARILFQDKITPSSWYLSRASTAAITVGSTFTQYVPITTMLNNSFCNVSVDFGCKKFLYDTSNKGQSGFMGVAPKFASSTTTTGINYFKSWFDENPPQIINMNNFSGTIRTRITNGDGFLLEDNTGVGLQLGDMKSWQMMISFTPIPSSAIETQCY
jgi:hypothetical protein